MGLKLRQGGAQTACRWGWDADFCSLTVSGKENDGRKILGAGVSGHQYYATVVLCALNSNGSGATYTVTTNYVTV